MDTMNMCYPIRKSRGRRIDLMIGCTQRQVNIGKRVTDSISRSIVGLLVVSVPAPSLTIIRSIGNAIDI